MTKVVLIRHGRSTANAAGVLAGRAPGVALDDIGRGQAVALGELLRNVTIAAAYSSPVERCIETATLAGFPHPELLDGVSECDYGEWTGAKLDDLSSQEVWADVQARPSVVAFPGGESMLAMFHRTTAAIADVAGRHGADEVVAVFSHGDPIKAILAHAFGMHLDQFQRLHVHPAGLSVIDYSGERPLVVCVNTGGDLASLLGGNPAPTIGGGDVAGVG
ncbi:MSMEG_4193 family putative phosphomutase [Tessaracoccus sp. MC1756]|uniref:MSMEG_4193 family putative phosphomutase n=1 Tax=Tessaracoccus sp. MC1756 TaxID=2760311 RepID=UPI001602276B|nr:MSMEG_4193 family putative phosphomutase [Tessaracoccus sp. MC1756]MBB1510793.1 MSMEG_4193 family putative phosphomutase [Tessaracoccus sp. MC1756]